MGGDRINTVGQTEVTIKRGAYSLNAVVQVQRKSPIPLLIGTNLQSQLGFICLQVDKDGSAIDLLSKQPVTIWRADSAAVVHLVRPVHLPANHGQLVAVKVDGTTIEKDALFESAREDLAKQGLSIEDTIIEAPNSVHFTLAIRNYNSSPVDLTADQHIGSLTQEITIVKPEDLEKDMNTENHVGTIRVDCHQNRADEIKRILAVEELEVKEEERMQLSSLIEEYEDIFAVQPSELGQTNVVQHAINTGDSVPLRQPARRIPFASRAKVDEMVNEMATQGVIQPSSALGPAQLY